MKRLFQVGAFPARQIGRHLVVVYPFKRDRFRRIEIFLPHYGIKVRTGKLGFEAGYLCVPSNGCIPSSKKSWALGNAILAAATHLDMERFRVRARGR